MSKKVIVTGGTGYIGSHTVVELVAAGYDPVIIDNLSNSKLTVLEGLKEITGQDLPFEEIDITDKAKLNDFFLRHDDALGVIHFAALKAVGESVEKPLLYYQNNISGLINIIHAMKAAGIKNHIFSSSCTVYGQPDKLPVTEQTPVLPANSPYGNTKQIGEEILREDIGSRQDGAKVIALRYFNPIGAHDSAKIGELPLGVPANLIPYLTQTAIGKRKQLSVFGNDYNTTDGTAMRDYIHVVDLAQAHVVALQRLEAGENKADYEVFNLGTGQGNTVLEVIQAFESSTGVKLNYKIVDRRPGDVEAIYADTTFAAEELGWKTKLGLETMVKSAWEWEKAIKS